MNARVALQSLPQMLLAPLRVRRDPPSAPQGLEHYQPTPLATDLEATTLKAADVPVAHTRTMPVGEWAPPVLAGCDEPLAPGAPDLRGVWQVHRGPLKGHVERVEQAGNRVVITVGGLVHDMFVDGTLAGGVNDVAAGGGGAIAVAARFEDGRLNLYPADRGIVAVTRYLDGDEMIWRWGMWRNRLRRVPPREA